MFWNRKLLTVGHYMVDLDWIGTLSDVLWKQDTASFTTLELNSIYRFHQYMCVCVCVCVVEQTLSRL